MKFYVHIIQPDEKDYSFLFLFHYHDQYGEKIKQEFRIEANKFGEEQVENIVIDGKTCQTNHQEASENQADASLGLNNARKCKK